MTLRTLLPTTALLTICTVTPAIAGPLTVTCAPGQRAIVYQSHERGERVTSASCVDTIRARRTSYPVRYRAARRHRSWGATALTIAGGASTGAGIGGIVNGRRGALIGAAIGGGAASLVESARRR